MGNQGSFTRWWHSQPIRTIRFGFLAVTVLLASALTQLATINSATATSSYGASWSNPVAVSSVTSSGATFTVSPTVKSNSNSLYSIVFCYKSPSLSQSGGNPTCTGATSVSASPSSVTGSSSGSGNTVQVSATVTGLAANSTYQVTASGSYGSSANGSQNTTSTDTATPIGSFTTTASTTPVASLNSPSSITESSIVLNGSVNTVGVSSTVKFCFAPYSATNALSSCSQTGASVTSVAVSGSPVTSSSNQAVSASITSGVAVGQTYAYQLSTVPVAGGATTYSSAGTFTLLGPTLIGVAPSAITATSATLNGTANLQSATATMSFCYSTSSTLSNCATTGGAAVNTAFYGTLTSSTAVPFSASIAGLSGGTTYYYEVAAAQVQNSTTYNFYSPTASFSTTGSSGPSVVSNAATSVTASSAVLNGSVTPNSSTSTSITFCYSSATLTNCSNSGSVKTIKLSTTYTGSSPTILSATASSLASNTTYYFQIKATQGSTTVYSSVRQFTTAGASAVSSITVSQISNVGATFNASATANNAVSTVNFCYSTSSTLSNCATTDSAAVLFTPASQSPIPATASNMAVNSTVSSGLTAKTKYYVQLEVTNAVGSTFSAVTSFTTIAAPFTCSPNFYQVSATNPALYVFSAQTNLFSTIGANTQTGFNALGYDGANNYLYVVNNGSLYEVDSSGTFTSLGAVSGIQGVGATFLGSSNIMLTNNGSGSFAVVDVSAPLLVATPFTVTTKSGSTAWGSADLTTQPNPSGVGYLAYGMTGSTLNILSIASTSATSGTESSMTVTSATSGYSIPSGAYGAAYSDSAGDLFFFNNGNSQMWEISAAAINAAVTANATTVAAIYVTTASPALKAANDGASCPNSINPFAPPNPVNDTYSTNIGTTLNVSASSDNGLTANDQSGTTFTIKSVTYNGTTITTAGSITGPAGTLTITDLANGYFTFVPSGLVTSPTTVTFTYSLIQTGVSSPQSSTTSATVTIYMVGTQSVTWVTPSSLTTAQSPYNLPLATTSPGGGAITYSVNPAVANPASCSINPTTGLLSFTGTGTCSLIATASATSSYAAASTTVSIVIGLAPQTISWSPTTSLLLSAGSYTADSGAITSGNGAITYSVTSAGTTGCTIDPNLGTLTYTGTGTCTVKVSAAATSLFSAATATYTFSIANSSQTMTWNPVTTAEAILGTLTFAAASPSGATQVTYSIDPSVANTAGCSIPTSTSPTVTFTSVGTCQIIATAAASSTYTSVSMAQAFSFTLAPQLVTWTPAVTSLITTQSTYSLPSGSTAVALGSVPVTYAVSSAGTSGCSVDPNSGALTFTTAGTCSVTATAAQTSLYASASATVSFTISLAPQTVTWSPTTALVWTQGTSIPTAATTNGNGAITYAVTSAGTTGCTVNPSTGVLVFTAQGSCVVSATAAATSTYAQGSTSVTFVIGLAPQSVTWNPVTTINAVSAKSATPSSTATTNGDGAITYSVTSTSGLTCTISNSSSPNFTYNFSSAGVGGTCTISASAAATSSYSASSATSVTFTINAIPNAITWAPTTSVSTNGTQSENATITSGAGTYTLPLGAAGTTGEDCSTSGSTITFGSTSGTCAIKVTSTNTGIYYSTSITITFSVGLSAQTITWSPTTAISMSSAGNFTASASASVGHGSPTYTFAITSPGTTGCSISSTATTNPPTITYTGAGTCVVQVTASSVSGYAAASTTASFVLSLGTQSVTWNPTTALTTIQSPATPSVAATTSGNGAITYSVSSAGTTNCTVNASTGVITYSAAGSCVVVATAAATTLYSSATTSVTFVISLATPTISWSPVTSFQAVTTGGPATPSSGATTTSNGAITYAVTTTGTAGCVISSTATGSFTYTGTGTCTITATAAATSLYASVSIAVTFTINGIPQVVTWNPVTTVNATSGKSLTPSAAASSSGPGSITYSVSSAGTAGCTVNSITGVISYTAAGTCSISANAASTKWYAAASTIVTFTFNSIAQQVTWSPTTSLSASTGVATPTAATDLGSAPIVYSVTSYNINPLSAAFGICSVNASTGALSFNGTGTCTVTASASPYGIYGSASANVTFVISGPPVVDTSAATDLSVVGAVLNGDVTSEGSTANVWFCYSTSATLNNCTTTDSTSVITDIAQPQSVLGSDTNTEYATLSLLGQLAPATTYYFQIMATNASGTVYGDIFSFSTPRAPTPITGSASGITGSLSAASATLNGTVDAGGANTTVWFCYSTSMTLNYCTTTDSTAVIETAEQIAGGANVGPQAFSQNLSGLAAGTLYYFEIVGQNAVGTTYGAVSSFLTPSKPIAITTPAVSFNGSGATLAGQVSSNGATTTYSFCYGTSPTLTGCTTVAGGTIAASTSGLQNVLVSFSAVLNGTYYYRIIASNVEGATNGAILSFDPGAPQVSISSATSVTSANATLNGTVDPDANDTTAYFCYSTSSLLNPTTGALASCTSVPLAGQAYPSTLSTPQVFTQAVAGLSPDTVYYYEVIATTAAYGGLTVYSGISSFETQGPPTATTGAATAISTSAGTIAGSTTAGGVTTSVSMCWGTSPSLTGCTLVSLGSASGFASTPWSLNLTGLQQGTTYYYAIEASNTYSGSPVMGATNSFTTYAPPTASATGSSVTQSGVSLTGTVNPYGAPTTVVFCYSTDATMTNCTSQSVSVSTVAASGTISGFGGQSVLVSLPSGLVPGVTYYFEVEAVSLAGTVFSNEQPLLSFRVPLITQVAPTSGSVVTAIEGTFSDTLAVTGSQGTVVYTETTSTWSSRLVVNSSGQVQIAAIGLPIGVYTVSGTMSDVAGGQGTWSYTLTVTATPITLLSGSTHGTVSTSQSASFSDTLYTSGNSGAVTFTETSSTWSSRIVVSGSTISVVGGTLPVGAYTVGGTMQDGNGDTGTWSYTLYVTNGTITVTPVSGTTTSANSTSYLVNLGTIGSNGSALTFTLASAVDAANNSVASKVALSSSGQITVTSVLSVGSYTFTGTVTDGSDTGTWTFVLWVTNGTLTVTPTSGSINDTASAGASMGSLSTVGSNGSPLTYSESSSANSSLVLVSSSGAITVTSAGLTSGSYTVSGTVTDGSDVGTWTYTLFVWNGALTQVAPFSGTTSQTNWGSYSDQLAMSGQDGTGIVYTLTSAVNSSSSSVASSFSVSSSGVITTSGSALAAGTYTLSGTAVDNGGNDSGTWTYVLTVTALNTTPATGTVSVAGSSTYSVTLATTNAGVSAPGTVYTETASAYSTNIVVSSSGVVITSGRLAAGTYTVGGTTSVSGTSGVWSFTLTVTPVTLSVTPTTASTSVALSYPYQVTLATTGGYGAYSYQVSILPNGFSFDGTTGVISTLGALPVGTYVISGTVQDAYGDSSSWSITVSITGATLTTTPTSGTTSTTSSSSFQQQLTTSGMFAGSAQYVETSSAYSGTIQVSSSGLLTISSSLSAGSYTVSGTTSDSYGESGVWSFTLSVFAPQTISFGTTPPSPAVFGQTYTVTASSTSLLTVVLTIDSTTASNCSIDGSGKITFLAVGPCIIDANQSGNGTYAPANQVQQSFSIVVASATVTLNAATTSLTYPVLSPDSFTVTTSTAGTVTFQVAGAIVTSCQNLTVVSSGSSYQATCAVWTPGEFGNYDVVAVFAPSSTNYASPQSSNTVTVHVAKGTTSVSYTGSAVGSYGVTQTLSGEASEPGVITFSVDGTVVCSNVATSGSSNGATCSWTPSITEAAANVELAFTASDINYAGATATSNINVAGATSTLSYTGDVTGTVGSPVTLSATASVPGTISIVIGGVTVCTGATTTTSPYTYSCSWTPTTANPSTAVTIDFTPTDTTNYTASSTTASINVAKRHQSITCVPPTNVQWSTPLANLATASSGLPVNLSSLTPSVCIIGSQGQVILIGLGVCTLQVSQPGNGQYDAATPVTVSFTVGEGPVLLNGKTPEVNSGLAFSISPTNQAQHVTVKVNAHGYEILSGPDAITMVLSGYRPGDAILGADGILIFHVNSTGEVSGTGFLPGSTIQIWLFSHEIYLGSVKVGENGRFRGTFVIPAGTPLGNHTIEAVGHTKHGAMRTLNAGIQLANSKKATSSPVSGSLSYTGFALSASLLEAMAFLFSGLLLLAIRRRHRLVN